MAPTDSGRPIFWDLADRIAADVLSGIYPPGTQVPSTTALSAFYRINPATAGKALNRLVEAGVLEKRRGLGMFVTPNGPDTLREARRREFEADYVDPLLEEASRLGLSRTEVLDLIQRHHHRSPATDPQEPS